LARLNLIAGKRAKTAVAYSSALTHFTAGHALLTEDCWTLQYSLTFELEFHRAGCEFLTGDLESAEGRLSALSSRAANLVDLAAVTCLRVDLYMVLGRSDRAVAVCLEYLRQVGVEWLAHPTDEDVGQEYERIWQRIRGRPIEDLIDLPLMNDAGTRATMDVLTKVMPSAQCTDDKLLCLIITRMVNLSLEYGNSNASCCGYVWFGLILHSYFENYPAARRFGQLGLDLVERRGLDALKGRVYEAFAIYVSPWTQHLRSGRAFIERAFSEANRIGDLTYASYCCNNIVTNSLAYGERLSELEREATEGIDFARKADFGLIVDIILGQLCLIRMLRGLTRNFNSFDDTNFDERKFEEHLGRDPNLAIAACWYWIRKLQARVFAQDHSSALEAAAKAQTLLWTSPAFFEQAEYHFYTALARAGSIDTADAVRSDQQIAHKEALAAHYWQIQAWAQHCPENFENRSALVGAELARVEGRELDAERLYEQSIRSAQANGFVQNEALSNELAARFYGARGFDTIAHAYFRKARYCYLRWGADGKVRQLDELYPHLRVEEQAPGPTTTIGTSVERLDLATVIKVSQAVSAEIVLEKLLNTLMRTAIEHAGAERGLLILRRGAEQRIEAEATTSGEMVVVRLGGASVAEAAVPESIVHYVGRTGESVILGDALVQNPFSTDHYIQRQHVRSLLCLPLIKQVRLIGLLYLENNLTPHVFTPSRVAVLKLLASQAAICLENTLLYRDLEEREAKIRRLVEANIMGIFMWNFEGQIIEANEAFLHMVNYSREDLVLGRLSWKDLTPPEWRDLTDRSQTQLKATGTLPPYEKEYFPKRRQPGACSSRLRRLRKRSERGCRFRA
jgi:PAS domain S-box-containing protein